MHPRSLGLTAFEAGKNYLGVESLFSFPHFQLWLLCVGGV